jgi:hypothetical protein
LKQRSTAYQSSAPQGKEKRLGLAAVTSATGSREHQQLRLERHGVEFEAL